MFFSPPPLLFSSVRDGVGVAVSGKGEESPEEADGVCGRSAPVESHRTTGEYWSRRKDARCRLIHTVTVPPKKSLEMTFVACFRSWRTVWFSLWLDVSSLPTVSDASWGFIHHLLSICVQDPWNQTLKSSFSAIKNMKLCWFCFVISVYLGSSLPVHLRRSPGQVVQGAGASFGLWSSYLGQNPSAQVRDSNPANK